MSDVQVHGIPAIPTRWVSVVADADPTVLSQLLGLVASINVCPTSMSAQTLSSGQLEWICELERISERQWQFLLRKFSQPTQVWSVCDLTAEVTRQGARKAG